MSIVSDADYESNVYVHKVDAEMRADCVSSVAYNVALCLAKGKFHKFAHKYSLTKFFLGESYFGRMTVHITLNKAPHKQLFLDFRGVSIAHLTINGTPVTEEGGVSFFRNHKIYLPTSLLKIGADPNIVC